MPGSQHHPVSRFMEKVEPSSISKRSCWQWRGANKANGYGAFSLDGVPMQAHRASYILFVGRIDDGLDVCHSCDNRSCVNPDHLFLGTRAENMADASLKGRMRNRRGQHLKELQVQEIRRRLGCGERIASVSRSTGVSHSIISNIKRGKSYVSIR
jgi:HNH endonuclease